MLSTPLLLHAEAMPTTTVVANVNVATRLSRREALGIALDSRSVGSALAQNGQHVSFVETCRAQEGQGTSERTGKDHSSAAKP